MATAMSSGMGMGGRTFRLDEIAAAGLIVNGGGAGDVKRASKWGFQGVVKGGRV